MLRITNGTTTITLSGDAPNAILGCTYWPATGGGKEITETIPVILEGSEATVKATVQAITNLLREAEQADEATNYIVYLEFQATAAASVYRSEIKTGWANWDKEPVRHKLDSASNAVEAAVTLTRMNFWEGPELELALSTAAQSASTGGRTIYNNDNATSQNNYAQAAANQVQGDLPTPLKVRVTNAAGTGVGWRRFHLCNNVFSDPANADVWLLGSEAVGGASQSWGAGGITHTSQLYIFNLSATLLGQFRGRMARVLAAFTSATAGIYFKAGMYTSFGGVYTPLRVRRSEVYNSDSSGISAFRLLDLGQFPIPPGGYNAGAAGGAALIITARYPGAGSTNLDFINLMASDGGDDFNNFAHCEQLGYTTGNGDSIELDGIDGGAFSLFSGSRQPFIKLHTDYLYGWPGKVQRFHVLYDEGAAFTAGRQMTLRVFHRPRVRTVG